MALRILAIRKTKSYLGSQPELFIPDLMKHTCFKSAVANRKYPFGHSGLLNIIRLASRMASFHNFNSIKHADLTKCTLWIQFDNAVRSFDKPIREYRNVFWANSQSFVVLLKRPLKMPRLEKCIALAFQLVGGCFGSVPIVDHFQRNSQSGY